MITIRLKAKPRPSAFALSGLMLLISFAFATPEAIGADSPSRRVLQGGTEATEYIMEGVPKYRDGMMAVEKKDYAAAEAMFKSGASQLGPGRERSRAECLYHQAACLELLGKADDASNVYKSAIKLFEQFDPGNPMKAAAVKSVRELPPEKTGIEKDRLMVAPPELRMQTAIKQSVELTTMGGAEIPVVDVIDGRTVPQTVLKSFAEMSCLETAELGANASNAAQRWEPLMVHNEPAAFTIDGKFPTINVMVNKRRYEVSVNLPGLQGLHKILLVTNKEKICAIDVDSNESWLLRMKPQKDGTVSGIAWSKLTHIKPGQPAISRAPHQSDNETDWDSAAQMQNSSAQTQNSSPRITAGGAMNGLTRDMSVLEDFEKRLGLIRSDKPKTGNSGGGDYQRGSSDHSGYERGASGQGGYARQNEYADRGGASDQSDSGF